MAWPILALVQELWGVSVQPPLSMLLVLEASTPQVPAAAAAAGKDGVVSCQVLAAAV